MISVNKHNASKIERINRFNAPAIDVGFYTRTAAQLMESQQKQKTQNKSVHRMGLNTFDRKISPIINAIRDDNPVADTVLFDIESLIDVAKHEIDILIRGMQQQTERFFVSHNAGISYDQPYAYSYNASWNHSVSYKLMWLIKEADIFFNQVNLAKKAAILTEQSSAAAIHQVRSKILNILHYVNRYRHSNITRTDLAHGTKIAQNFLAEAGDNLTLKSDVLLLKKRAETAPRISSRPSNKMDDIQEKLMPIYEMLRSQEDQEFQATPTKLVGNEF